jgi:FlaA1/EpsC-like NDP-sugar epimerase
MNLEEPMGNAKPSRAVADGSLPDGLFPDWSLEDLLGRKQEHPAQELLREHIQGKVVMVTGAAGSIGSELCRQIAGFNPLALVGFDQAETALFQLESELTQKSPGQVFHSEIGSIGRLGDVTRTIEQYRPSIVFHAAAYKHIPMLEKNVLAAVDNNIFGTWHVAQAAASHGVESFILISTDKAVCPASVMGATKRVAELSIRALNKESDTKFVAVRLGNVLGSSGSVVPIFKRQIAEGGPVTVTHPDMRRYFMTAPEAGQLVLYALAMGKGGEIFVLDMGEPLGILDLARNLILLSGMQPDRNIQIEFTGVRPGEKLVEELHNQDEQPVATSHSGIYNLSYSDDFEPTQLAAFLEELKEAVSEHDALRIILLLKQLVSDYIPSSQVIQHAMSLQKSRGITDDIQAASTRSIEPALAASK